MSVNLSALDRIIGTTDYPQSVVSGSSADSRVTVQLTNGAEAMARQTAEILADEDHARKVFEIARIASGLLAGVKGEAWEKIMQTLKTNDDRAVAIVQAATPFFRDVTDDLAKQIMIAQLAKMGSRMEEISNAAKPFLVVGVPTNGHARAEILEAFISSRNTPLEISAAATPFLQDVKDEQAVSIVIGGFSRAESLSKAAEYLTAALKNAPNDPSRTEAILNIRKKPNVK